MPSTFALQLKGEVTASKIKSRDLSDFKPVFFPVWSVPFNLVSEEIDISLWERQLVVSPEKTLKVVEDLSLLQQGFTGAMVRSFGKC